MQTPCQRAAPRERGGGGEASFAGAAPGAESGEKRFAAAIPATPKGLSFTAETTFIKKVTHPGTPCRSAPQIDELTISL
ncbi:hypothetical protein [Pseudoduganella namucuonensis]|uniref:hypothetical protein n=1 Tax=Pseudoduganella namucuonensis TaxID=1035707 RepID=UPI0011607167|nr:hypothetical protein [Pseudoduganella namucuonensis]